MTTDHYMLISSGKVWTLQTEQTEQTEQAEHLALPDCPKGPWSWAKLCYLVQVLSPDGSLGTEHSADEICSQHPPAEMFPHGPHGRFQHVLLLRSTATPGYTKNRAPFGSFLNGKNVVMAESVRQIHQVSWKPTVSSHWSQLSPPPPLPCHDQVQRFQMQLLWLPGVCMGHATALCSIVCQNILLRIKSRIVSP